MKTTNEIKKFLKEALGVTAKGNTGAGRTQWQSFYVPCDRLPNPHTLQYSLPEFPVEFRHLCLRTIYGDKFEIHPLACAGNVGRYSIAMVPSQWEMVIGLWLNRMDTKRLAECAA
jgi:hypothetical protein